MLINNSFNILPWYDSLEKQSSKKWYAFGQSWPLLCPQGYILPFQFISDSAITIQSNIFAINKNTGNSVDLGVRPIVMAGTQIDASYHIIKMASTQVVTLPVGTYYLRFNTNLGYLYSEEITVIDDASECVKVQYWNEDTLYFMSGEINFADDFKFELYIRSTIGKPEYEFEEELTKRLGYKFIESQTSNKVYKFAFMAPEYICDAMRLIRLCDYVKLTTKFDSYNALSFAYEPKWQEQGDLAAVDVEFDTDCIIQKLESFNRRLKESFYNALLADIDEPVLFSPDTVAQYYTEFKTTSFINGKLIRELASITPANIKENAADLVFPVDSLSDESQEAKKMHLADLVTLIGGVELSKLFKGHYDESGNLLWIEALAHVGSAGDFISFIDNGTLDLPSIYDGLPIDGQTIVWEVVDGIEKLVAKGGGTGEGNGTISSIAINGTGNAITSVALNEDKTRLTFIKGMNFITSDYLQEYYWNKTEITDKYYSKLDISNNYYNKFYIDENFITKDGASELFVTLDETQQDINGVKNFVGELQVNGNPIVYNSEEGYWMLDGDLLVTGDITSFANEDGYTPSSIMDALRVDETNLKVIDGVLTFVGSTGGSGGVSEKVTWANIEGKPTWIGESKPSYSWSEITGKPNFVTEEYLDEEGFLTAMDIQVLTFKSGTFNAVSYDPSMAPKTVNIPTKLSHLEDDSDFVTLGMMSSYATKTWVGKQGFLDSSDLNGYATEKWVGQQGFATEDWVDENYFSINGGQLHGDLWLRSGTESYGRRIIFGDVRTSNGQPYVYIGEDTDDDLTIASWGDFRIKVGDGAYLTYIKDDGYWEITGDLLVTGGITSYE